MIAVLGWTDGFGNDTYVEAIFRTLIIAHTLYKDKKEYYRWVEFDFGQVDFDWYEVNEFTDDCIKKGE